MIIEYQGKHPKIGKRVFIAPTAVIIGDVENRRWREHLVWRRLARR
jgi:carbonic anhydrase/acetyltransferase-like protein (isoleucine patch superfamily)